MGATHSTVMPGLVPGIHVLATKQGVDGRDKPGHDGGERRGRRVVRRRAGATSVPVFKKKEAPDCSGASLLC